MQSATTVIPSAILVMGRRQSASVTLRMAEISVPAWLIPIKKTKFEMYRPQEIWSRIPVSARPLRNCRLYANTPHRMTAPSSPTHARNFGLDMSSVCIRFFSRSFTLPPYAGIAMSASCWCFSVGEGYLRFTGGR